MKQPKRGDKVLVVSPNGAFPLLKGIVRASAKVVTADVPVEVVWNNFCRRRLRHGDFQIVSGGAKESKPTPPPRRRKEDSTTRKGDE